MQSWLFLRLADLLTSFLDAHSAAVCLNTSEVPGVVFSHSLTKTRMAFCYNHLVLAECTNACIMQLQGGGGGACPPRVSALLPRALYGH